MIGNKYRNLCIGLCLYACVFHVAMSKTSEGVSYQTPEEKPIGTYIGIPIRDTTFFDDSVDIGQYEFSIINNEADDLFGITSNGAIIVKNGLDRETICPDVSPCEVKFQVNIQTVNQTTTMSESSSQIPVTIHIEDINDNAPMIPRPIIPLTLQEEIIYTESITTLKAVDPDEGTNGEVSYHISDKTPEYLRQIYTVNETTGEVMLTQKLDFEFMEKVLLSVVARDHGQPPLETLVAIAITVTDINDNAPSIQVISLSDPPSVYENSDSETLVEVVGCTDSDSGLNGECWCSTDSPNFSLIHHHLDSSLYKLSLDQVLDREQTPYVEVDIKCADFGTPSRESRKTISGIVLDVNDNAPVFEEQEYHIELRPTADVGDVVLTVSATDVDEGQNAEVAYSLDDLGQSFFSIDPQTGEVTTTAEVFGEIPPPSSFKVIATDNGFDSQLSSKAQVTLTIV